MILVPRTCIVVLLIAAVVHSEGLSENENAEPVQPRRKALLRRTRLIVPAEGTQNVSEEVPTESGNDAKPLTSTSKTLISTTTTTTPTKSPQTQKPSDKTEGCFMGNQRYFEGQFMPDAGGPCRACYCLRGRQQCSRMRCKPAVEGCTPVVEEGRCCPVRYDCDEKSRQEISKLPGELVAPDYMLSEGESGDDDTILFDAADIDFGILENHVRIERQSQQDVVDENEVLDTTEGTIIEETTVINHDVVEDDSSTTVSEKKSESSKPTEDLSKDSKKKDVKKEQSLVVEPKKTDETVSETSEKSTPETIEAENVATNSDSMDNDKKTTPGLEEKETDLPTSDIQTTRTTPPTTTTFTTTTTAETSEVPKKKKKEVTLAPPVSIKDLLAKLKLKDSNKESLADIIPDPITGTHIEDVDSPDVLMGPEEVEKEEPEFFSYDINVGTSLKTGNDKEETVGVGQVFPVDIETPVVRPRPPYTPSPEPTTTETPKPTTTETPKPQASFLDTFLNLFGSGSKKEEEKKEVFEEPPMLPPPPPFKPRPPPFTNLRPPPSFGSQPENNIEDKIALDTGNAIDLEVDYEGDLEAKPTIENEVRTRPRPSTSGTRNELPIRRRPASDGSRPLRPGLFASRPNIPISAPPKPIDDDKELPNLPSNPVIEGGFEAIQPASDDTVVEEEETSVNEEPTLPPSLPNLQIIPFVAADALVNQGSPPSDEVAGFNPKPFRGAPSKGCREGGKVWKNGETVAKGDNDPCVLCRCLFGKVICQRLECPNLPEGCVAEDIPAEGECCPKMTCEKSANVSIIDTLPSFKPIKEETEDITSGSKPIRPSAFAHQNRRPPFASGNRPRLPKPLSSLRKQFNKVEESKPEKIESREQPAANDEPKVEKEEKPVRTVPRRPIRPVISRNTTPKPLPKSPSRPGFGGGGGGQLRPYSSFSRTGTRRPFIPPRNRPTTKRSNHGFTASPILKFTSSAPEVSTQAQTTPTTTATSTTIADATITPAAAATTTTTTTTTTTDAPFEQPEVPQDTTVREELEPRLPIEEFASEFNVRPSLQSPPPRKQPTDFETFLSGFVAKEEPPLPTPIHSTPVFEDFIASAESNKPFVLPPGLLLPKPLPPSNMNINDDDIINFVKQDKFRVPPTLEVEPEAVFNRQPIPVEAQRTPRPFFKPLPEIPDEVKAQLPLGNDPILVSGLLELGGCNVYGRMFDIGQAIEEISGQCKACQCTKVGVQCLPIC